MKKGIMVLCHSNPEYAKRFIQYANDSSRFCLEVCGCTSLEEVRAFLKKQPAELCLIEDVQMIEEVFEEERLDQSRILILSSRVYDSGGWQYTTVYQYQSMPQLLDQIGRYYLDLLPETSGYCLSREIEKTVITVFGFVEGRERNAYALEMARQEGQKKRVLYVNMEPVPGIPGQGEGIYELLYYITQKHAYGGLKLSSLCEQWNGIHRLISPCMLENYFSLQGKDVEMLMDCIFKESDYEVVVIDLAMYMPVFEPIFTQSSQIYFLKGLGREEMKEEDERVERLKECFTREGRTWTDKMEFIRLPLKERV